MTGFTTKELVEHLKYRSEVTTHWAECSLVHPECAMIKRLQDYSRMQHENEMAWVLLANAYDGDWELANPQWREAAEQWKTRYLENAIAGMARVARDNGNEFPKPPKA